MVQSRACHPETLCRFGLVPVTLAQSVRDRPALEVRQVGRVSGRRRRMTSRKLESQMLRLDKTAFAQNRRAFEHIAQFPDVARPAIAEHRRGCIFGKTSRWATERTRNL